MPDKLIAFLKQAGYALLVLVGLLVVFMMLGQVTLKFVDDAVTATLVLNAIIVLSVFVARLRRRSWFTYAPVPVPIGQRPKFWLWVAFGTLLAFLAGQSASVLLYGLLGSENYDSYTQTGQNASILMLLTLTLVLAPLGEEALLRGLLFPLLRKRIPLLVSVLLTTALFMLIHGNMVQAVVVLPLGVLQALVYERTRRLLPVVLMHLVFNVAALLVPAGLIAAIATPVVVTTMIAACAVHSLLTPRAVPVAP